MDNWDKIENLLSQYRKLDIEKVLDYNKYSIYSIVYNSTALEGSTLTELETQILLDDGLSAKGKPLEHHLMVKDNYNALISVIEKSKIKAPLTPELIRYFNSLNMKNTGHIVNTALCNYDGTKGDYRLNPAFSQALGYYLDPKKIESAVVTFCNEVNSRLEAVKTDKQAYDLSFDCQFNLIYIHPWSDGNKRTSRLLTNYIQNYFNLPLSKVFLEDLHDYLTALKTSKSEQNTNAFKSFMYSQLEKFLSYEINLYDKNNKSTGFMMMF